MNTRLIFTLLPIFSMLASSFAKTPTPLPLIHATETTAKKWTLQNGLTLIVQEDHSAPVASVQAWCRTGSIDEDKHLGAGLSHILEHMLFKGTKTRANSEIAKRIQDLGGYINAYTSYDRTVFWIDIPAKGAEMAVDILSDAMMNSTLPPEEYKKEQEVIRREFAMGYDDPDRMAGLQLFATSYREHPSRLPVIGYLEIYNQLTREDVMEYYKARYVPNNLFFVVVGDVDGEKIHSQVEKFFADYPQKSLAPHYIPEEPIQLGRRESHTEFPTELTRLDLAWHTPELTHPDVPALDLLSTILGDGRSSILYRKLREEQGLVHAISAFSYTPSYAGLFGVEATLDPDKRAVTERVILENINELKEHGVTEAELEKAKKQSLSTHFQSQTTMRGKASDLGSNWLLTGNLDFSKKYLESIQRVTIDDIKRVLSCYFTDQNLTVTSLNPVGSLKETAKAEPPIVAGEIQKFVLSNGLRLLVREDSRLPLVAMVASFKAGLLAETPSNNGITKLFAKAVLKGTKSQSAEQIANRIEEVGGSIGSDAGNNSFSVSVKVMQSDLKLGLELLSDVLLNPIFPVNEVAREKESQLAGIKAEEEEMTVVARNLMRTSLFPNHPYGLRSSGTPESVGSLDQKALINFQKEFVCGKNGVLAVFGNVKANEVKTMLENNLAKLPAGNPALIHAAPPEPLQKGIEVETHKEKAQAILMVGYQGADLFSPDREALELIDEASSDLGSRFFVRIREKMGLAYFVGSSQTVGLVPGPFVFYLGTAPQKVEAVKSELLDEISKLAHDGLTQEELTRAKEKLLGQQDIHSQSNDAFAYACALDELYGLGFDHYKALKKKVESITLDEVKQVANKYFETKPAVIAMVRPKPKVEIVKP